MKATQIDFILTTFLNGLEVILPRILQDLEPLTTLLYQYDGLLSFYSHE